MFPASAACVAIRENDKETANRLWVVRDVSEQVHSERALQSAKDEAERANAAKSRFLANMSHELRTPLNAVIGFSEMIRDQIYGPVGNDRYKDYASDIHASGTYLLSLINDLLDLTRIERGKFETEIAPIEPRNVVGSALRTIKNRAEKSGIRLRAKGLRQVPPIAADERALQQCLLNLLSNAVKFTPRGGRVAVTVARTGATSVRFSVTDTGCGISQTDLARIGQPFVQTDAAQTVSDPGTGLGLSITRELVSMMDGSLAIESELGIGTTASITLPIARGGGRETRAEA